MTVARPEHSLSYSVVPKTLRHDGPDRKVSARRRGAARGRNRLPQPSGLWMGGAAALVSVAALLPLGFYRLGRDRHRMDRGCGYDLSSARRRAPDQYRTAAGAHRAALRNFVGRAGLADRADGSSGARIWSWLAVAPLAVPAFVHSYAWISIAPGFDGLWAAVLISVLAYFPFLYLPVAAALRRLDPGLEDAAASLGLSPWRALFRVVLPQLRIALCGGALLIGLHLLGEYGLYGMIRFDTFTTAIVEQFQSTFNGPAAKMLLATAIFCLALLALYARAWPRALCSRRQWRRARCALQPRPRRVVLPAAAASDFNPLARRADRDPDAMARLWRSQSLAAR